MKKLKIPKLLKGHIKKWSLIIIAVVISIITISKTFDYASSRYSCHVQWMESGVEYKYTLRGGCLLKRGSGWIPAANFRIE